MSHEQRSPQAHIERLSIELLRVILCALPDIATLQSAVLSGSTFYLAFQEAKNSIATQVVLSQIGADLLPDAAAALESSTLSHRLQDADLSTGNQDVKHFMSKYVRERPGPADAWPLGTACRLGKLHACIYQLAQDFALEAMACHPLNQNRRSLTPQELCRIERTLYRFEVYCNLLRGAPQERYDQDDDIADAVEERNELFFENFASYEIEQLGCIHDFLVRLVSPAFNEVARHDVTWGMLRVDYGARIDSPYIQQVLSHGLTTICNVARAETYEDRHRILESKGCPSRMILFLYGGLQHRIWHRDTFLSRNATTGESEFVDPRPFHADPDSGPEDAWQWAHAGEAWPSPPYEKDRHSLRRWGYVLWDSARLEANGIFENTWTSHGQTALARIHLEHEWQREDREKSWERREKIHVSGGRGWWSWRDESRVRWADGKSPGLEGAVGDAFTLPSSLQEARDMMAMMNR